MLTPAAGRPAVLSGRRVVTCAPPTPDPGSALWIRWRNVSVTVAMASVLLTSSLRGLRAPTQVGGIAKFVSVFQSRQSFIAGCWRMLRVSVTRFVLPTRTLPVTASSSAFSPDSV